MQVVARVEVVGKSLRVVVAAHGFVEIDASVKFGGGSEPFVERHADEVAVFVVGTPTVNRQQRAAVNFEAEFACVSDVERTYTVDEVVCGGHVAPGAELVDFDTDGVDDVVDAVLHDDATCTCDVHFDRESRGTFEAVGGVGDATVFAENACAADCTADNRYVVVTFADAAEREVIGPILCRDGIAEADKREVLFFGENVDGVEEVNPVRFAREVVGKRGAFRKVAVAVLAAGKWARDSRAGVHLCEVCEVHAYVERFACGHVECNFVAQDFFACGDGARSVARKGDGCRGVHRAARRIG